MIAMVADTALCCDSPGQAFNQCFPNLISIGKQPAKTICAKHLFNNKKLATACKNRQNVKKVTSLDGVTNCFKGNSATLSLHSEA